MLASGFAAQAADMPQGFPYAMPQKAPGLPVVSDYASSAWYLRGDIGGSWAEMTGIAVGPAVIGTTGSSADGGGVNLGIGFGIKSRWLRTDVTVDHTFASRFSGSVFAPGDLSAKVGATSALFNGYIDLGTWYGVTPYIGAGAGAAFARVSDYQRPLVPFTGASTHTQTNFAYALMGGIAWSVTPNLQLDIGYRYLNIGDVKTASDPLGDLTIRNVSAHQVRIGVRWGFDEL